MDEFRIKSFDLQSVKNNYFRPSLEHPDTSTMVVVSSKKKLLTESRF